MWIQTTLVETSEILCSVQTLDVFGRAVFGYEFNSLRNADSEVVRAFRETVGEERVR